MKNLLLFLSFALVAVSCSQDDIIQNQELTALKSAKAIKVDVCHYDENAGTWHVISINSNALKAHLAHGDVLLVDKDGDGWVEAKNECVKGGDCNDNDPEINPGMDEVCGNGIDDNCDGKTDEDCCPYWSVDEIVALAPTIYFNFREMGCFEGEQVGFIGTNCPFGLDYTGYIFDLNCEMQSDINFETLQVCDEVLVRAQAIIKAAYYCKQFAAQRVVANIVSESVNPLDLK